MSTTADTGAGLLRAIIDEPADDGVRLIYADWLAENGQEERSEFIRVQVELACLEVKLLALSVPGPRQLTDRFSALRRRERDLLDGHFGEWTDFLPEFLVTKQCPHCVDRLADWETNVVECSRCECTGVVEDRDRVEFRRGLVAEVDCALDVWCGKECRSCYWRTNEGTIMKWCHDCHGTGRIGGHGPALVCCCPLELVTLTEWRGPLFCSACWRGARPTDRHDLVCEVCHSLYDSAACIAWARSQPVPV